MSQSAAVLSHEEMKSAIRALTPAQWLRLRGIAFQLVRGRPMDMEDLLQEAFVSALDGRNCPTDVDIVVFLRGVMRSVLSNEAQKAQRRPKMAYSAVGADERGETIEYRDPSPTIEEDFIDRENAAAARRYVLAQFDDDPDARVILEGDIEGWSAEELRAYTGLDKVAYASKRRLIIRRLNKMQAKGESHD